MVIWQLEGSTLYLCNPCLDELGPISGKWKEEPLGTCSVCGEVDQQAQEEMHQWCHDMDQQQWEEEQQPADYNPQELK